MKTMFSKRIVFASGTALVMLLVAAAIAQEKKEARFHVEHRAIISISNSFGPITVKGAGSGQVVVTTTSHSPGVTFENEQHGNRIALRAVSESSGDGVAEYVVLVPMDAWVTMRSSSGSLHAEGLQGDLFLEAVTGPISVQDIRDGHIHLRSLDGPITLSGIRSSQVDVNSVSGDVTLHDVAGSLASVHSGGGRIFFEGDPGANGDYALSSNSGDLEISIPAKAAVDIKPRSLEGQLSGDALAGGSGVQQSFVSQGKFSAASVFVLRSFRGKIHVKRP